MSASHAIHVEHLRKQYRGGWLRHRKVRPALDGVSLSVEPGQVFGLLGPNGAGKTTLIKVLLGIVRGWSGTAHVLGAPAGSVGARREIGYLPENLRVPGHHTARTALAYYGGLSRLPRAVIRRRSDELLELVGLGDRDREPVGRFSKGMVQRLGLAQALLHEPQLLVLDEPTDGLDPVGRAQVRAILDQLRQSGKTIFLNSHILQEVELVCDRVAILVGGRLRGVGSVEEISRSPSGQEHLVVDVRTTDADRIRTALAGIVFEPLPAPAPATSRVSVAVSEAADVDRCVDRLRGAGLSLVRLERKQPSLEEVFLSLVGPGEAEL